MSQPVNPRYERGRAPGITPARVPTPPPPPPPPKPLPALPPLLGGLVVRSGDTLLVWTERPLTHDVAADYREQVHTRLPGLADVVVLNAAGVAAYRPAEVAESGAYGLGYAEAVARLRDDERYLRWWSADGAWQHKPTGRYWDAAARGHLADYLETINKPLPTADGEAADS